MATTSIEELTTLLKKFGLQDYIEFLAPKVVPTLEIAQSVEKPKLRRSRFGGNPELPRSFRWPTHAQGLYRFLGQIDFSELPGASFGLPNSGLLSLFYLHDDMGEICASDADFVRAFVFDPAQRLKRRKATSGFQGNFLTARWRRTMKTRFPPVAFVPYSSEISEMQFSPGMDLPPWPPNQSSNADWPIDESLAMAYWEMRTSLHTTGRYLFGYPFHSSLAYDPLPGPTWRSLLTIRDSKAMDWYWMDSDWLMTFIETDRLQAADFTNIKAESG